MMQKLIFIDDWKCVLMRAWSIRVAAFWIFIGTIILVVPIISEEVKAITGPWWMGGVLFLAAFSFGCARVLKEPGTDQ